MLIKTGCCGFCRPISEYANHFPVIEVQQTFYQPPKLKTLERWRASVPDSFEFTLKAWQLITHEARSPTYRRLKRKLSDVEREQSGAFRSSAIVMEAWESTLACAAALRARYILFQCPASFTPTTEHTKQMRRFFLAIKRPPALRLLWEPRGPWPGKILRDLCSEMELLHVVDPFVNRTVTPEFCYFRLHGRSGFRYSYADDELEELVNMLPRSSTSYVLFNNVRMLEDAVRFQKLAEQLNY